MVPSTCTCDNKKYLKNIADTSVKECNEVIFLVDIVPTKMTNIIVTNVSLICDNKTPTYQIHWLWQK